MQPIHNLTIIILSYNSSQIIESCLNHLNFEKYKVVVVDNASRDNTVAIVQKNFPKAQLIRLEKNLGYGNGNNQALKLVKSEFALILNPDSIICEDSICKVLKVMQENKNAALAGPVILKNYPPFNQDEISDKIAAMERDLVTIRDCYYEKIGNNFSVRFIVGAALFMRVSVFQKIDFFDKNFFLYYEDDELCNRTRKNGFVNLIVPDAVAFHIGGQSCPNRPRDQLRKSWHLSWSKLYWKKITKGSLRAKRSAAKLVIVYLVKILIDVVQLKREKILNDFGACMGSFSFLIGLGAFKSSGTPRMD